LSSDAAPSTGPGQRLRADAARNRARILDAAQALFAERGTDVQMEEVARKAGVGIGTLYRHFATKEAMIEAASERRFEEGVAFARAECAGDCDPLEILARVLSDCAEKLSADRGFSLVVEATLGSSAPSCAMQVQLEEVLADLLRRGQEAGSIRPDIVAGDIYAIASGMAAVILNQSGDWRRYVDIMIEGLRAR
jgi:AcrR family transcriptional regulator